MRLHEQHETLRTNQQVLDASSSEEWRRERVALDSSVDPALLGQLGRDPSPVVRMAVLRNDHCPAAVLQTAANNPDAAVREAAIGHTNCPTPVLMWAVRHLNPSVRLAAARNPVLSQALLRSLAADDDRAVRWAAISHLQVRSVAG